ncbi:UPF0758 domain-containing protein [Mucilaginibacter rubeus]|uniref:UPF0758 domain-containing protein n=1 Tax=Mucilaginibacter rubeus TaxID=2027860 RepID=A0A5C1HVT5_9SPHI|nr:UPF0758 domain-containing protein [Mucilaginibacter rubeus]QEM09191.1 hypothetical protein DEO27_003890 [Mucilaginibacter rubeus]
MHINILAEEKFSYYHRHYNISVNQAVNHSTYLRLACTENRSGEWETQTMRFFEGDIGRFIESLNSVFRTAAYRTDLDRKGNLTASPEHIKGIKSWAASERPREKLMEQGREVLSDAELLAMLICAGLPGLTAVDLAEQVLAVAGNDLKRLAALKVEDLMTIRGIGHARALSVISAMELAVRLAAREQPVQFLKLIRT